MKQHVSITSGGGHWTPSPKININVLKLSVCYEIKYKHEFNWLSAFQLFRIDAVYIIQYTLCSIHNTIYIMLKHLLYLPLLSIYLQ